MSESDSIVLRAQRVQAAAARLGFDWPDAHGVVDKLSEELREIQEALHTGDIEQAQRELGDLMLAATHLATHLNCDADTPLQGALTRFEARFEKMRKLAEIRGFDLASCTLDRLEALWQESKTLMHQHPETGG